jgi:single-strand DNA-binding protein
MIIVHIEGFLGADPEERFTATKKRVISLRVATRVYQSGQEDTVWWNVNIWDDRFANMISRLKKGSAVYIVAEMTSKPKTYTARDGTIQVSLTINGAILKFSSIGRPDRAAESPQEPSNQYAGMGSQEQGNQYAGMGAIALDTTAGDDLPF